MTQTTHAPIVTTIDTPSGGELIELTSNDSINQPNESEVIAGLALLSLMDYDRARKENARALGIQVKTLDALVKAARSEVSSNEDRLPFPDVEPHEEPIDLSLIHI